MEGDFNDRVLRSLALASGGAFLGGLTGTVLGAAIGAIVAFVYAFIQEDGKYD